MVNNKIVRHAKRGAMAAGAVTAYNVGKPIIKAGVRKLGEYLRRNKSTQTPYKKKSKASPGFKKGSSIIHSPAEGSSFSKASMKYKMPKIDKVLHKIDEPTLVQTNKTDFEVLTCGIQDVRLIGQHFWGLAGLSGHANNNINLSQLYVDCGLNPGQTGDAITYSGGASKKFLLDSLYTETLFTSATNVNILIDIYDLVARQTSEPYNGSLVDWQNAIGGTDGGVSTSETVYDAKPTANKEFNLQWRVVKKTTVDLGQGRSHKHVFNFQVNRLMDTDYIRKYGMIKGITCNQLIIMRGGQLVKGQILGISQVTTGDGEIFWECTTKARGRNVSFIPRKNLVYNNLQATLVPRHMAEFGDGTDQPTDNV